MSFLSTLLVNSLSLNTGKFEDFPGNMLCYVEISGLFPVLFFINTLENEDM